MLLLFSITRGKGNAEDQDVQTGHHMQTRVRLSQGKGASEGRGGSSPGRTCVPTGGANQQPQSRSTAHVWDEAKVDIVEVKLQLVT